MEIGELRNVSTPVTSTCCSSDTSVIRSERPGSISFYKNERGKGKVLVCNYVSLTKGKSNISLTGIW